MFKTKRILPNILFLEFESQKLLTLTLCRIQEYYESGDKRLWRKKFSWPTFLDTFTNDKGELSYFSFWKGFNFPSTIFHKFFEIFKEDLSPWEKALKKEVLKSLDPQKPFYIIASGKGRDAKGIFDHEMAHAFFFLNLKEKNQRKLGDLSPKKASYKTRAEKLVKELPPNFRSQMEQKLLELGYGRSVIIDEIQAYLATTPKARLRQLFQQPEARFEKYAKPFVSLFKEYL